MLLSPIKTRRNAKIALTVICALVCGGLGWATFTAIRLENFEAQQNRDRAREALDRSNNKTIALALAHIESILDSALAVERTRPFEHYRAYYKPARAISLQDGLPPADNIVVASPLQDFTGPDWQLLHFQVSVIHGWSSPQLESFDESTVPASAMPPAERAKHASAANWLAALKRYDPFTLQHMLETAQEADIERSAAIARVDATGAPRDTTADPPRDAPPPMPAKDRTAAEFARRGQRLVQLQRQRLPAEQCEPWTVAIENLQTSEDMDSPRFAPSECVVVSGTPMFPIWLDLTMDDRRQLALVRSVSVEQSEFCTLQGVLIDWELLKKTLEAEIQDMLPGARIEPIDKIDPLDLSALRVIPARLVARLPGTVDLAPETHGLAWGIGLTWSATILTLIGMCWGAMKYVSMVERRMQFAAAVTHELRTPLTAFQIYTDLLAEYSDDPGRRAQCVQTLQKESKRLGRLVENVLVYSQITGDAPRVYRRQVAPRLILDSVALHVRDQCRDFGKSLQIANRCRDDQLLETDAEFVVQILVSLIENACKYSQAAADPTIWLSARVIDDRQIEFAVEDAGTGVAAAERKAVFKPFHRSEGDHKRGISGMGLGLALARYWAHCLGGQLEITRGEHGAARFNCFTLRIPIGSCTGNGQGESPARVDADSCRS